MWTHQYVTCYQSSTETVLHMSTVSYNTVSSLCWTFPHSHKTSWNLNLWNQTSHSSWPRDGQVIKVLLQLHPSSRSDSSPGDTDFLFELRVMLKMWLWTAGGAVVSEENFTLGVFLVENTHVVFSLPPLKCHVVSDFNQRLVFTAGPAVISSH